MVKSMTSKLGLREELKQELHSFAVGYRVESKETRREDLTTALDKILAAVREEIIKNNTITTAECSYNDGRRYELAEVLKLLEGK